MGRRSIQLKKQREVAPVVAEKSLSEYSWHELRAYAKSLGLSTYRISRENLEAAVQRKVGEHDG